MKLTNDLVLIICFFVFIVFVILLFVVFTDIGKKWVEIPLKWKKREKIALKKRDVKRFYLLKLQRWLFLIFNPAIIVYLYLFKKGKKK